MPDESPSATTPAVVPAHPADREPVFRVATCNDLLRGRSRRPDLVLPEPHCWGLKQMGFLWCLPNLPAGGRVLEIGVGRQTRFESLIADGREYWAIDKSGFYEPGSFDAAKGKRGRTRMVDGLMGDFHPDLPDDHFDLVFSVSVLEHVPSGKIADVCRDIYRVLKPGGWTTHTLDVTAESIGSIGGAYLAGFEAAGFVCPPRRATRLEVDPIREAALIEPLSSRFLGFGRKREDPWKNPKPIRSHAVTVLIRLQKPERPARRAGWFGR